MNTKNATASEHGPQASILAFVPRPKPVEDVSGLRRMGQVTDAYPRKIMEGIRAGRIAGARREGHRWVAPRLALIDWANRNRTKHYCKASPLQAGVSPDLAVARHVIREMYGKEVVFLTDGELLLVKERAIPVACRMGVGHLVTGPFLDSVAALVLLLAERKR